MGIFLTGKSRIEQTEKEGYWKTIDNEIYLDDDGTIILTPRRFWTDGYTFPRFVMALLGDKNRFDVRGAHAHDLACRFHEIIRVNLPLHELHNYIKYHPKKEILICEDIPRELLLVDLISKSETNNLLKRMMRSCGINKYICNLVRFGVTFNINWYFKTGKKSLLEYNIYEEDIDLVNEL